METENGHKRHAPLVAGRYEPLRLLGAGGMGDVYLADDRLLARRVALKLLKKHLAEDADALARFRKEALAAASLSHPNIVLVFDAGEDALSGGAPYIAMEHVPGGTLAHLLAREGPLRPTEAARIAAKVALALNEAHAKGIVHRDVKPQNVLLDERGEPKVTDFGIALAATSASAALTRTAMIVGTARYLSPEQARGDVATEKSDLYSLGIVLYEMLTGCAPFDADNPVALALKHVTEHPAAPSERAPWVAPAVEAATLALLSKRPAERPRNAAVAARMLFDAAARADAPSAGSEPTARISSARDPRLERRRRRGLAVAGIMCAGLFAVPAALAQPALVQGAYSAWFGDDAQPVGRIASPLVEQGGLGAPAPAPPVRGPEDPPPAPNPAEKQSPPPEPEPPASDPPPAPDARASQYAPAPASPPSQAPPPSPATETAQPEFEQRRPPVAQQPPAGPADDPAPRPDPSPPQPPQAPAPAAIPERVPAPEPPVPSQRAAPEPVPQTASPAPQPGQNPAPQSPRIVPQPPVLENEPTPQANPGRQDAEEHAGRRR